MTWGCALVTTRPRCCCARFAAARMFSAKTAAPAAFSVPVEPWTAIPAPVPFVPWKSATTDVGMIQYGTYLRVTWPRSERSATFRRRIPLFSQFPPAFIAASWAILLSRMKCFWKICAPAAPIVVTAPQYSHTTTARPCAGFRGAPHEVHFVACGTGGGGVAAGAGPGGGGEPGAGAAWGIPGGAPGATGAAGAWATPRRP